MKIAAPPGLEASPNLDVKSAHSSGVLARSPFVRPLGTVMTVSSREAGWKRTVNPP